MLRRSLVLLVASAAFSFTASAQVGGGAAGGIGGGNSRTLSQSEEGGGFATDQDAAGVHIRMERPLYLSGNVVLASGETPPEPIMINRVCAGQTTSEGFTDSKGHFSFQLGGDSQRASLSASSRGTTAIGVAAGRAAVDGPVGVGPTNDAALGIDLSGCSLTAVAPGYRSNPIRLGHRRSMDYSDAGTIILTPLEGAAAAMVSASSLAAPKKARALFDKAAKELGKGPKANFNKAAKQLEEAVALYPEYAAAWTLLGQARLGGQDVDGAAAALETAMAEDPRYLRPYEPMIRVAIAKRDWPRVTELAEFVLSVDPGDTRMRWYKAICSYEEGRYAEAMVLLDEIQNDASGARSYPQTHHIRGLIHAKAGKFEEAAAEYRLYLELAPTTPTGDGIRRQLFEWEQLGVI